MYQPLDRDVYLPQTLPWIAEPDKLAAMCRWECAPGCASSMGDDHLPECVDTDAEEN